MWFIGVEVEQDTSAPPPKKNPGSAPVSPISEHAFLIINVSLCAINHNLTSSSSIGDLYFWLAIKYFLGDRTWIFQKHVELPR